MELTSLGTPMAKESNRSDFVLGDPGAHFGGMNTCDYAMSGARPDLFHYLIEHFHHVRWLSTAFVLVDNRDLTESSTPQESLAHWPTVEAWWQSRLAMYGPAQELCDLVFVPISQIWRDFNTCIPLGLARLSWLLCPSFFQVCTLRCSIVTVSQLPYSRLQIFGKKCRSFRTA